MSPDPQRLKDVRVDFARGNIASVERYLADDVRWNILGNGTVRPIARSSGSTTKRFRR